jgi:hypothetical protein
MWNGEWFSKTTKGVVYTISQTMKTIPTSPRAWLLQPGFKISKIKIALRNVKH